MLLCSHLTLAHLPFALYLPHFSLIPECIVVLSTRLRKCRVGCGKDIAAHRCLSSCDAAKELAAINAQYPFTPLKWLPATLRLPFAEGIQMLNEAGYEVVRFTLLATEELTSY